jgi:hypothetical protein
MVVTPGPAHPSPVRDAASRGGTTATLKRRAAIPRGGRFACVIEWRPAPGEGYLDPAGVPPVLATTTFDQGPDPFQIPNVSGRKELKLFSSSGLCNLLFDSRID